MYEIFEQLLQEKGLTPYEVSKLSGVSQATLSDWKLGKSSPRNKTIKKIADCLGVSVAYLKGEEKIKNSTSDVSAEDAEILDLIMNLPDEKKQQALDYLQYLYRK